MHCFSFKILLAWILRTAFGQNRTISASSIEQEEENFVLYFL